MNHSGKIGEGLWADYMSSKGYSITTAPNGPFYDRDIKAIRDDKVVTFEVKYDEKAYWWAKRRGKPSEPNLYIEFKNTNKGADSGILASKADYYIYIMKEDNNRAYVFNRVSLCDLCITSNFKVVGNSSTGDDNAEGWIPPLSEIVANENVFIKSILLSDF